MAKDQIAHFVLAGDDDEKDDKKGGGKEDKGDDEQDQEDDDESDAEDSEDEDPCLACGGMDNPKKALLCDGCDGCYHMYCLIPPLKRAPRGDVSSYFLSFFCLLSCPFCIEGGCVVGAFFCRGPGSIRNGLDVAKLCFVLPDCERSMQWPQHGSTVVVGVHVPLCVFGVEQKSDREA